MTKPQVPEDIFRRLDAIERRLNILEGGPQGNVRYNIAVRSSHTLGTGHTGAASPTTGESGDILVGTGKLWVNDGGTWKSVTVS